MLNQLTDMDENVKAEKRRELIGKIRDALVPHSRDEETLLRALQMAGTIDAG